MEIKEAFNGIVEMELLMICGELQKEDAIECYSVKKERELTVFDDEFDNDANDIKQLVDL